MKKTKQRGGTDIISASVNTINSMIQLGKSIFTEIDSITHINQQINNVSASEAIPNQIKGPPSFQKPNL